MTVDQPVTDQEHEVSVLGSETGRMWIAELVMFLVDAPSAISPARARGFQFGLGRQELGHSRQVHVMVT